MYYRACQKAKRPIRVPQQCAWHLEIWEHGRKLVLLWQDGHIGNVKAEDTKLGKQNSVFLLLQDELRLEHNHS